MAASGSEAVRLSQLNEWSKSFLDKIYPVGSIYLSMSSTNPSALFGGTWSAIQGRFLVTSDSTYAAGDTGGSNDAIVVSHSHGGSTGSSGSHTHDASTYSSGSHSHSISGGSHKHTATCASGGAHTHTFNWQMTMDYAPMAKYIAAGNDFPHNRPMSGTTTSNRSHSHTITVATSSSHSHTIASAGSHTHTLDIDSAGSHSHTVSISSTGSSGTNANMPKYIAVNAWQCTA